MSSSPQLDTLPPELTRQILCLLPDVPSLLSAVLTCRRLHSAFVAVDAEVSTQVVWNFTQEIPEAAAAWNSSCMTVWTIESIQQFMRSSLRPQEPSSIPATFKLSEAVRLYRLHRHVQYFSLDMSSQVIAKFSESENSGAVPSSFPSPTELYRIQRALYRFEIYCNLFRSREHPRFDLIEQRTRYFSKFSPWEIEQLACVHDYLFYKARPAFDEITDHDVKWGAAGIHDAIELNDPHLQYILSRGLSKLHAIAAARDYDERRRQLCEVLPTMDRDFLHQGLQSADARLQGAHLPEYVPGDEAELNMLFPPFMLDPDTGPAEAWRWAYLEETSNAVIYSVSQKWLRDRGYVFWDRSRLDTWPVFQSPWQAPDTTAEEAEIESCRATLWNWERCARRSQIANVGGKGWWSLEDESKVVYPPGVESLPRPDRGVGRTSQQAADDFQRRRDNPEELPTWQTWRPNRRLRRSELCRKPEWNP